MAFHAGEVPKKKVVGSFHKGEDRPGELELRTAPLAITRPDLEGTRKMQMTSILAHPLTEPSELPEQPRGMIPPHDMGKERMNAAPGTFNTRRPKAGG